MLSFLYIDPSSSGAIMQGFVGIIISLVLAIPIIVAIFYAIRLLIKWCKKKYDEL